MPRPFEQGERAINATLQKQKNNTTRQHKRKENKNNEKE